MGTMPADSGDRDRLASWDLPSLSESSGYSLILAERSGQLGWEQAAIVIALWANWANHSPSVQVVSCLILASFRSRRLGRGCKNHRGHHRSLRYLQSQGSSKAGR